MGKRYRVRQTGQWYNARAASTANVTIATGLNATDVIDGVTLADGNRVLLKNQTTASENGIYVVAAVPVRASDWPAGHDSAGEVVKVAEGTANAGDSFLQYSEPGVVGTDGLLFIPHDSPGV